MTLFFDWCLGMLLFQRALLPQRGVQVDRVFALRIAKRGRCNKACFPSGMVAHIAGHDVHRAKAHVGKCQFGCLRSAQPSFAMQLLTSISLSLGARHKTDAQNSLVCDTSRETKVFGVGTRAFFCGGSLRCQEPVGNLQAVLAQPIAQTKRRPPFDFDRASTEALKCDAVHLRCTGAAVVALDFQHLNRFKFVPFADVLRS